MDADRSSCHCRQAINKRIREQLSPKHMPGIIAELQGGVPINLNFKKVVLPSLGFGLPLSLLVACVLECRWRRWSRS
jgi:hypothetical protein